ncbi:lipase 3-like [Anticarsia gemmatalis]|uniref:lipase 3-like n=1 Tax=Anticarsia gemmatalis TaxID=129554 RepID=UPI003F767AB0
MSHSKKRVLKFSEPVSNLLKPPAKMKLDGIGCTIISLCQCGSTKKPIQFKSHRKILMNATQIIKDDGYKSEEHDVLTDDGYMLTLHRILPNSKITFKQTVVLHHGLLGSSEDWLLLGPNRALPYLLADHGFDVWLLNARGNKYSRAHVNTYIKPKEYWNFSWHEMGIYDLPATLTYINELSVGADLHFIGHSMGATALLVLLSSIPEYNDMVKSATLLAPLAFMGHTKGPLKHVADLRSKRNYTGPPDYLMKVGKFSQGIIRKFCKGNSRTCSNTLLLAADGGKVIPDAMMMEKILAHATGGGSMKTLIHYMQLIKSGQFRTFNYDTQKNKKTTRVYNLRTVSTSLSLFSAASDWLSSPWDIVPLLLKLDNVKLHHIVKAADFGHLDFVWSLDAPKLVFKVVLAIFKKFAPTMRRYEVQLEE